MGTRSKMLTRARGRVWAAALEGASNQWAHRERRKAMRRRAGVSRRRACTVVATVATVLLLAGIAAAQQKPNIIMIMGDDIGWFNIGAYHQGMMASRTPNLDRLAAEGMRFTDYYAEA